MRKDEEGHITVSTREARSGETTGRVRVVLIVGTILAMVGLAIVGLIVTLTA